MIRANAHSTLPLLLVLVLGVASHQASAVQPSMDESGQVLLFPAVAQGLRYDNLLALTNRDAERPAILRLTLRDGRDGRPLARMNIFLGGGDSFAAAIDGTALKPADDTCFVSRPAPGPDGSVPLNLEGAAFLEVIEMATVTPRTATAALVGDIESDCATLEQAIADRAGSGDLEPPMGRLTGHLALIDVPLGLSFPLAPMALDAFRDAPLYEPAASRHPNLNDASPAESVVFGDFPVDGIASTTLKSTWRHPVDAVSAVLMADTVDTDFNVEPGISADTDVILTFPTRHHYQGVTEDGERAPFVTRYVRSGVNVDPIETPGQQFLLIARNRQGNTAMDTFGAKCSPLQVNPYPGPLLTGSQLNLRVGAKEVVPGMEVHPAVQVSTPDDCFSVSGTPVRELMDSGYLSMDFSAYAMTSLEGHVHTGLPVLGSSVTAIANETSTLANYGIVTPLRRSRHATYPVAASGLDSLALDTDEERLPPLTDVSGDGSVIAWAVDRALPEDGFREYQDIYVFEPGTEEPRLLTPNGPGPEETVRAFDLSSDGQALAYVALVANPGGPNDTVLRLHTLSDGATEEIRPPGNEIEPFQFPLNVSVSNGGSRVAYQGLDSNTAAKPLFVYDGAAEQNFQVADDIKWLFDMTPDGSLVLYSTGEIGLESDPDRLHLVETDSGVVHDALPADLMERLDARNDNLLIQEAVVSDSGRFVAFSVSGGIEGFYWYDRQADRLETISRVDPVFRTGLAISGDGMTVAWSEEPDRAPGLPIGVHQVFAWGPGGTPRIVSLSSSGFAGNGPSRRPALSADGSVLAYSTAADNIGMPASIPDETQFPAVHLIRAALSPGAVR